MKVTYLEGAEKCALRLLLLSDVALRLKATILECRSQEMETRGCQRIIDHFTLIKNY